jgi:hypothetical protein
MRKCINYKLSNIIITIKVSGFGWPELLGRIDESKFAGRVIKYKQEGTRNKRQPKLIWMDGMGEELRRFELKGSKCTAIYGENLD